MKDLNYIGNLLLDSYKEHITDKSYIAEMEDKLCEDENKLDSLFRLFNADERIRKSFAKKIDTDYEDLKVFLRVLQKV